MARDAGPPPGGATRQQDEDQQPAAKKGGGLLIQLIVLIVVALAAAGGGFGLATFVLGPRMESPADLVDSDTPETAEILVHFKDVIANISSEYGSEFLVVDITLGCPDDIAKKRVEDNQARILDALNALLSSKTYEDIQGIIGREQLQRAVKDKLNGLLGSGTVENVYFPSLVVQSM
jgi:flagellar basal body-associated protein FliL